MAEQEKEILEEEMNAGEDAQDAEAAACSADSGEETEHSVEYSVEHSVEHSDEHSVDDSAEDAEAGTDGMSRAEKKAAKKQAKQDKKADVYKEKIAELEDKTRRQLAEFENFRRRSEKEKQAMFETGARSVIEKILPVVDNFERGLATVALEHMEDPFVDGMNRIYKQLLTELDNMGVKPIEAVGCEFNPDLHNAVMQAASEEYESGVITQELLKGYTYRDTVVRHSMVAVAE